MSLVTKLKITDIHQFASLFKKLIVASLLPSFVKTMNVSNILLAIKTKKTVDDVVGDNNNF